MPDITQMIVDAAGRHGVAPALAIEVATAESNLNPAAVSPVGAIGIFQLMPATAAQLGVDPHDPAQNIDGGVRYLRQMLGQFGDIAAALGAYNWGPGAVSGAIARYGAGWLAHAPGETQNYVAKILAGLGMEYTVQAPLLMETFPGMPGEAMQESFSTAPSSAGGFGTYLLWGVVGIFALWVFQEAT